MLPIPFAVRLIEVVAVAPWLIVILPLLAVAESVTMPADIAPEVEILLSLLTSSWLIPGDADRDKVVGTLELPMKIVKWTPLFGQGLKV
jgi:hypothetical protein